MIHTLFQILFVAAAIGFIITIGAALIVKLEARESAASSKAIYRN